MPEPATRDAGAGAGPQDLRGLVQEMSQWRQSPVSGTSMVAVSLTSALPENKRAPAMIDQMVAAMTKLAARTKARFYRATVGDFVMMVKADEGSMIALVRDLKIDLLRLVEQSFPGSFGTIDQTRLVVCYDLISNYRSAADRVTRFAQTSQKLEEPEGDGKLRPLTGNDIERVLAAYKKFGSERFVKAFVRHQEAVSIETTGAIKPLMSEYFISMDLLRKPLMIDVEMRGSGRLFNEFTLMLDQIMLEAFPMIAPEDQDCSMNLNVQSVFTPVFEQFIAHASAERMRHVIFEFRQANIVEHFDEFQTARGLIKDKGARIAVDQIFPQTVGLVDLDYLGASLAKVHWRPGAEEVLNERKRALKYIMDCGVIPILIRVDDPNAVPVGHALGITAFQGFSIDGRMKDLSAGTAA